ncbi:uncharacterized protein DUF937 [Anseongella ginsenosidimutans]|uniref:Uncharacterized protein DUF937 n=1 Tax=Anseongella ginsenosidimutans TaxID=496056 RepID=A0A4R3KPE2_9SPHI|nr:DUF937 domain-containing protein [Anseongella ginsenosidimutans]QEC54091.1 DUF937 domain-containing protein [Anseongella ginsenosidimutans]TCS85137.1 uncharacterized protein DUF937 [Anseongella ginsenosidimutans]
MLEKLLEQAKGQLIPSLIDDPEVDNAHAEQIAEVSGDTVINSLLGQARSGDYSGLQELLSGNDTDASSPAVNNLVPQVAENLISRLGLSPEMAQNIAGKVIPMIMNMLNGKVQDAQSRGIDIGGLLGGLMSGNGQGGGLLGKLGGMFGGGRKGGSGDNQPDISSLLGKFF